MNTEIDHEFYPPPEKFAAMDYPIRVRTSTLSVISLVSGIVGITVFPILGQIVAIATGHAALKEIRESPIPMEGKGLARVGLGLGYVPLVLALIVGLLILIAAAFIVPAAVNTVNNAGPAIEQTLTKFAASRGVKMANELSREDTDLIAQNQIEAKPEEILACYYSGFDVDDPEFAVLTKTKLIYLKEGRKTEFDLKDVAGLKDDRAYELAYQTTMIGGALQTKTDPEIFHVEVQSQDGRRMRIEIKPDKDGPLFFDALKSAVETAGGTAGTK